MQSSDLLKSNAGHPFSPIKAILRYESIVEQIMGLIDSGTLRVGDKFPPERTLAEQWQVSRPVLREAFRVLERQGVVKSRAGGGRYLQTAHIPSNKELRAQSLLATRDQLLLLWEIREPIELMAVRAAVERADDSQIEDILRPLAQLKDLEPEEFRLGDFNLDFHMAIARASNNPFTQEALRALIDKARDLNLKGLLPLQDWRTLQDDHQPIADAIAARDVDAAVAAMKQHFEELRNSIKDEPE